MAEETISDSIVSKSDSVAAKADSSATEPDSTPLVRTAITTEPLMLILGLAPNLTVERMITSSVSAKLDGYWGVGKDVARAITGSVRYRFSPGLAGKSVGVFVRAIQEDVPLELEVDGETEKYKLRNEGIVAGLNYGSRTVWRSGFTIDWYAGAGWPFLRQEWRGAVPEADASLYRKVVKVLYGVDLGLAAGYAF